MNQLDDLKTELIEKWSDDPAGELCLALVDFLRAQPEEHLRMLTYYSIGRILEREPLDENVLRAVTILVSTKVHALERRFLFIDDEKQEYELDNEEIEEVQRTGNLVHPETGDVVEDFESKLVPFFVPSDSFLRMKAERNG